MIGSQVQQVWQKTGLAGESRVNTRTIMAAVSSESAGLATVHD